MKIIILTQYFPPEIGAPQNRLFELAIRLLKAGVEIEVLTAMPNYPDNEIHKAYKGKRYVFETIDNIPIHRAWIYVPKSRNIFARLLNYFSFVWTSYWVGRRKLGNADYLMVESPPLFLGMAAHRLAKRKKAKMIFNVSDLWPESAEKLGLVTNKLLLRLTYKLEARLYRKSTLITGQTQGIVKSISDRFPEKKVYWLPNGVDLSFYDSTHYDRSWRLQLGLPDTDFLFLYAGIIGHAQGLEIILQAAELLKDRPELKFVLVGSGPEKARLLEMSASMGLNNVMFVDAVNKATMPFVVASSDVAIIPLKRLDIFKGAIPSKIFENLAMKKPLLLGVEGEAKELFIDNANAGMAFEPENATDLARVIVQMIENPDQMKVYGNNGFQYVKQKFNRDVIAAEFLGLLKEISAHE